MNFSCTDKTLTEAFSIAVSDIMNNVKPYKDGLLDSSRPCLMAGHDYDTPWTRDTAINVWNAMALLDRTVARDTLLSVLERRDDGNVYVGGEYWDCMIWAQGAMQYILLTGDKNMIPTAKDAICRSLRYFEKTEFDSAKNLFRGPAVYGDGVAAYPDKYANANSSGIKFWQLQPENKDKIAPVGVGLPMFCLSTNCVYFRAYEVAATLCEMLSLDGSEYKKKAAAMKEAINRSFWNDSRGSYDYMAGEWDAQEALGDAFAILFGVADREKAASMVEHHHTCPHGTPCLWPNLDRYASLGGYGRHAGTIWPHAQGFWARAAFAAGDKAGFEKELFLMSQKAVKNGQFHEIYHPDDGRVYGGLQEFDNTRVGEWGSCSHQTWSASTFLSLIFYDILGIRADETGVTFAPCLPTGVKELTLTGLSVGSATFDITVTGNKTATYPTDKKASFEVKL